VLARSPKRGVWGHTRRKFWRMGRVLTSSHNEAGTSRSMHSNSTLFIWVFCLKCNLLGEKDGLYLLVLLASPRWLWCPGEYLLVSYSMIFCMEPEYIRQDISATWEKLIKPTYRAHLFHQVSCTLILSLNAPVTWLVNPWTYIFHMSMVTWT